MIICLFSQWHLARSLHCSVHAMGPALELEWETDLEEFVSDSIWRGIIGNICSSSICLGRTVVRFGVVHRLHCSRDRLSGIRAELDPACSHCGWAPSAILYAFCTCPRLQTFWQSIFGAFSEMCGKAVRQSPLISQVVPVDASFMQEV